MTKVFKAQRQAPPTTLRTLSNTEPASWKATVWSRVIDKLKHVKGAIVAVAGVGAVLSGLVGYYTTYRTVAAPATSAIPVAPGPDTINPLSILVLPFSNQTGDPQKGYIADGLSTSLTSDLARIRDAFVVPAPTAFVYKDKPLTIKQVAGEAGVRFVLHGNVLSAGDKLRISAQLTDAPSGAQLWSDTFEGDLGNLFALQDQITRRIGGSIGPEMVVAAARDSEKRPGKPKAADLVLRAKAVSLRAPSLKNSQEMQALLRQALAIEPDRVDAKLGLAFALERALPFGSQMTPAQRESDFKEARELALQVREVDPEKPGGLCGVVDVCARP